MEADSTWNARTKYGIRPLHQVRYIYVPFAYIEVIHENIPSALCCWNPCPWHGICIMTHINPSPTPERLMMTVSPPKHLPSQHLNDLLDISSRSTSDPGCISATCIKHIASPRPIRGYVYRHSAITPRAQSIGYVWSYWIGDHTPFASLLALSSSHLHGVFTNNAYIETLRVWIEYLNRLDLHYVTLCGL